MIVFSAACRRTASSWQGWRCFPAMRFPALINSGGGAMWLPLRPRFRKPRRVLFDFPVGLEASPPI
jgi:hypothetical protein